MDDFRYAKSADILYEVVNVFFSIATPDIWFQLFCELADTMKYGGGVIYNLVFTELPPDNMHTLEIHIFILKILPQSVIIY